MFRLATDVDLLSLKFESPGDIYPMNQHVEWSWGLKSFGYMLAIKHILGYKEKSGIDRPSVVEAGVGLGDILWKKLSTEIEFTAVDRAGFYDIEKFNNALSSRGSSNFIDTHFGEFNSGILDESADVVCSVSVLEHVPIDKIHATTEDIARTLKPGGLFVHTLDVNRAHGAIWEKYLGAIRHFKFEFLEEPKDIDFSADGLLYEPTPIVYRAYEKKPDLELKKKAVSRHQGTIIIVAHKHK